MENSASLLDKGACVAFAVFFIIFLLIGAMASCGGPYGQFQSLGVKWVIATRQKVDPGGYLWALSKPITSSLKELSLFRSSG
jgi:hypothetical protein